MTILFQSVSKEMFVFHANNVSDIVVKICEYIDNQLLEPEDLENFISLISPSNLHEINLALTKRIG